MQAKKLSVRLALSFGLLLLLLLLVAGLGVQRAAQIHDALERITEVNNLQARLAVQMRIAVNQVANSTRNILLLTDAADVQAELARLKTSRQHYDEARQQLAATFTGPGTTPQEKALLDKIVQLQSAVRPKVDQVLQLALSQQVPQAIALLLKEVTPPQSEWLATLGELADLEDKLNAEDAALARENYISGRNSALALALLALVVGTVTAVLIIRGVLRQLGGEPDEAATVVRRIASGDLSQPIVLRPGDTDSLLATMQQMQTFLVRVVKDIRSGSESIATGSSQIATGNADLSQRTEEQASNLQQTAASMEEMNATVKTNADTARQASQLSASASAVALQGGEVVGRVTATMGEITEASKRIADIIGVIDGIAFQTNILALNAAVEAARAGEQGRGFAVVASEVRGLAQRSGEAAREIRTLIGSSVERVESGTRLVDDAGRTMQDIVASVQRVADTIGAITASAAEQSQGIGEISQAVSRLDHMTQQNAALVEQSAAAAESLKTQAASLSSAVSRFRVGA